MKTTNATQASAPAQVLPHVTIAAAAQIKRAFLERNDTLRPRGAALSAVSFGGLFKVQVVSYPCAVDEALAAANAICGDIMGRSDAFLLPFEWQRADAYGRDIYRAALPLAY